MNLGKIELMPVFDPVSHLVYAAARSDVSDVWVNGKHVVKKQHMAGIEKQELESIALVWQNRMK